MDDQSKERRKRIGGIEGRSKVTRYEKIHTGGEEKENTGKTRKLLNKN